MTGPLFSFSGEKKAKAIDDARHTHARSHTISTSLYRCGRCRRLSKTFVRPTFWRFLVWGRRKMFKTNDVRQAAALVKSIDGQTSYSIWLDRWPPGGLLCSLPQQREMCVYIHWLTVAPVCVCVWAPPDQVDLYSPCRRLGKKNKTKQTFSNWISDADALLPYRNFGNKILGRFFHSSALLYSKVMEQLIGLGVSSASLSFFYYRITFLTRTHFFSQRPRLDIKVEGLPFLLYR